MTDPKGDCMRIIREIFGMVVILFLCGALFSATAQTAKKPLTVPQAYCVSTGGTLETRYPVYGTNGSSQNWLQLAGRQGVCQYTQASDGSRLHVSLETLTTTLPRLAALAYYSQTPPIQG